MNINEISLPNALEGDKLLWTDNKWYIFLNGTWILETTN
jgi:hypothetical protein